MNDSRVLSTCLCLLLLAVADAARADVPQKPLLTLQAAERVADAAQAEAGRRGATVVIAVVDDGGYPVLLRRLDDTQVASSEVAVGKARTAAIFRRPSRVFEEQIREGRVAALALPGATPLQGGLPLHIDGRVVGAIGVSGNTPQEDEAIAQAAVAALDGSDATASAPGDGVRHFERKAVEQAFAKGAPLVETPQYKVHASRRTEPGLAEVHLHETDVIHVLEGGATLVTGGSVVEPETTAPGEIRGASIEGGESRRVAKGDVLVVPQGTPHWFREVEGTVLYFVVKPIR